MKFQKGTVIKGNYTPEFVINGNFVDFLGETFDLALSAFILADIEGIDIGKKWASLYRHEKNLVTDISKWETEGKTIRTLDMGDYIKDPEHNDYVVIAKWSSNIALVVKVFLLTNPYGWRIVK